jgi:hypothetical protein
MYSRSHTAVNILGSKNVHFLVMNLKHGSIIGLMVTP